MKAAMSDRVREILNDPEDRETLRKALNKFHSNPLDATFQLKNGEVYTLKIVRRKVV